MSVSDATSEKVRLVADGAVSAPSIEVVESPPSEKPWRPVVAYDRRLN